MLRTKLRIYSRIIRRKLGLTPLWVNGPAVLQVELHNYCNEKCVYCNVECFCDGKHGVLKRRDLVSLLRQVKASVFEVRLFMNNEPTLPIKNAVPLKDALKMVKGICGVRTVIYSNGVTKDRSIYLDKNLDHIHLTISAATSNVYEKVHGEPYFNEAYITYRYIVHHKRSSQKLFVHFVEVKDNLHDLDLWRNLFGEADGLIISPLHDGVNQQASKECIQQIDYKETITQSTLKGKIARDLPCTLWNNLSVSCFGEILQCCDSPYKFNYGKVGEITVREAWLKRLLNSMDNEACRNCGLRNKHPLEIINRYVTA